MPSHSPAGQPAHLTGPSPSWFESAAGQAVIVSETDSILAALQEREGHGWLWLAAAGPQGDPVGRGLRLVAAGAGWDGPVRCEAPLPLANESVSTVVVQHVAHRGSRASALVSECARVLVPGGRLWLYCLNPVSPYRIRWSGWPAVAASEPIPWRRRLREAGLQPDAVSQGVGPRWRIEPSPALQHGAGLRAAWVLRAEKRAVPLTPVRQVIPLRMGDGVPAA